MRDVNFKCSYDVFNYIRDEILNTVPHGLISSTYANDKAYFKFWDSQYIPAILNSFLVNDQRDKVTALGRIDIENDNETVIFLS